MILAAASHAPGSAPSLSAMGSLEPGLWRIRDLANKQAAPQSICVPDPALLAQVQHGTAPCSRLIIADSRTETIVHYTCPANGFGRTSLRAETPRLAKIDTQGIYANAPFAFRAEARWMGPCGRTLHSRR